MKPGPKILGISADWKALAFCVLAASTFWFFNAMKHNYTVDIYYPFEIRYDDTRVVPVTPLPKKIKINVTGYGWRLLRKYMGIKTTPIVFHPDNLPHKTYVVSGQLTDVIMRQITDLEFNYMTTDSLYFRFDYLKEKKVKVIVDSASIGLAPSYRIISPIIVNPDSVIFRGPSSSLASIPDSIKVGLEKTDIKEDFEESIKMFERGYPKVEMLNKEVKVRFNVKKFEKQSTVVTLQPENFPDTSSLAAFDSTLILTYYIQEEDKNKVLPQDFEVALNYADLDKTDSTIKPRLVKKPDYVNEFYFTPYAVKIGYER